MTQLLNSRRLYRHHRSLELPSIVRLLVLGYSVEVLDAASVVPLVLVHAALVREQILLAHALIVVLGHVRTLLGRLPSQLLLLSPAIPL